MSKDTLFLCELHEFARIGDVLEAEVLLVAVAPVGIRDILDGHCCLLRLPVCSLSLGFLLLLLKQASEAQFPVEVLFSLC